MGLVANGATAPALTELLALVAGQAAQEALAVCMVPVRQVLPEVTTLLL